MLGPALPLTRDVVLIGDRSHLVDKAVRLAMPTFRDIARLALIAIVAAAPSHSRCTAERAAPKRSPTITPHHAI